MAFRARVFVDTATVRHSIRSRTLLFLRKRTVGWGGQTVETEIYEPITFDPTAKVDAQQSLRNEIDLLSDVRGWRSQARANCCGSSRLSSSSWVNTRFLEAGTLSCRRLV